MSEVTAIIENFEYIKTMRSKVSAIFQDVTQKTGYLNKIYSGIVKNHSMKEYTFGLDSFYFQTRLIELENENLNKMLNILTNRFYCEYYKLYKIIEEFISNEINDVKLNDKFSNKKVFPVYKDLDKNANYDFSLTIEIQRNIVKYIHDLDDYLRIKNIELKDNTKHSKLGINIENIVNYQHFFNALLHEKITMFVRYLEALNKHHTKYINRLFITSKSMIDAVNEDIMTKQFNNDHTITPADNEHEDLNNTIKYEVEYKDVVLDKDIVLDKKPMLDSIREEETDNAKLGIEFTVIDKNVDEKNNIDTEKILHRSISDFDLNQQ